MDNDSKKAVKVFKNGGVVIFPTDTAIGIGCRMDDVSAVKKVYSIRNRPKEKAVLVLVDSIEMAEKYLLPIDSKVKKLMQVYWPGGLTIIVSCKKSEVPAVVRADGDSLGLRMPDQSQIRKIITEVGVPIIAPSANFSGGKTPFKIDEVDPGLEEKVDFVLKGTCTLNQQSTIIDCSKTPWRIQRFGAVKIDDI